MTSAFNEEEDSIIASNHGYCVLRRDPLMSKQLKSLRKIFDKSTKVFGVYVFGTSDVDDSKFDHAVNVLRDYLDNDGDGVADSKKLVKSLKREKAAITIFSMKMKLMNILISMSEKFGSQGQIFRICLISRLSLLPTGRRNLTLLLKKSFI